MRTFLGTAAGIILLLTIPASGQQAGAVTAGMAGNAQAVWHGLGSASWRVENGQIIGKSGVGGGWLVSNRAYQDLGFKFSFRCSSECQTGVLLGMEEKGDRTTGLYVSLAEGDLNAYELTIDSNGKEIERRKFDSESTSAGRGGNTVGRGGNQQPEFAPGQLGHPLSLPVPRADIRRNEWNDVEIRLYTAPNTTSTSLNVVVNGSTITTGYPAPQYGRGYGREVDWIATYPEMGRFGALGVRVAGPAGAEIRLKDVSILNYTEIVPTVEKVSSRFRLQRVTPYFHGDGACVGDINQDGHTDIVAGHMAWLGPDFKKGRVIDVTFPLDPKNYGPTLSCEVADFTGDGWVDVLMSGFQGTGPVYLYVNPKNQLRRWPRYKVIDTKSETSTLADIDGDGKPEYVSGGFGYGANYAEPDPSDPTKPWVVHHLTEKGNWGPHALGVGDVNGDGRLDVLRGWGWWEQPKDPKQVPWKFHPEVFGRSGQGALGGAQMYVYDVNGDGLNDVITSLGAHVYGLAWFEQKRDMKGSISFVQHMIMDRDPAQSHGVVFSEMHGVLVDDVDGDGLKDIITGKNRDHNIGNFRYSYTYPADEDAENVLYWFKLVRKPRGAVDFVPHLIHNDSGVGRQPRLLDLNGDGVVDIVNNGRFGTMVFWGKKGATD